ncbi:hypothetical protein HOLleu_38919 [Holothuria leucospilota]|uniref:Immunoglobulin domain-containing protein n=1 Tax=Holothuria leucospilota TaxID=206669 RepID=A0A9Q0YF14_HOLLE|nr:hypothetical protein HOLleu_38919 [Holothuria leucospilota]
MDSSSSSTIMNLYCTVLIIFKVCNVQADEHKTITDKFYLNTRAPALTVREGIKVILICPKSSENVLYINFAYSHTLDEGFITLIDSSKVTDISDKYSFNETNENTYVFTINSISRDDEGTYTCVQVPASRALAIIVIYSPSGSSPKCLSNYKSPIIFYDELTDDFVFNCSTERGKPPVTTNIYVNEQNEQDVTSELETVSETRTDADNIFTTYSLFRHFNHTLQNSEFVCNVTQQLPSPYDDYQGSCSFGPLHLLPGFSLSISPSLNDTVSEERNITVTCTSNVTGVKITWITIPSWKKIVTNYSRSSVLTIFSFKPASYETIFVECSGTYGSRTITANTTLFLMVNAKEKREKKHANGILVTLFVVFIVSICIGILLVTVALCILRNKRKRKERPLETLPCNNVWGEISTSGHSRGQTLSSIEETSISNTNNKTYTTTVRPESQDSEKVHVDNISTQIYHRTIVMDEPSTSYTKYYDISSKSTVLYDSSGYLIPGGSEKKDHTNRIYDEIDR